jgi:hypothetical protein
MKESTPPREIKHSARVLTQISCETMTTSHEVKEIEQEKSRDYLCIRTAWSASDHEYERKICVRDNGQDIDIHAVPALRLAQIILAKANPFIVENS